MGLQFNRCTNTLSADQSARMHMKSIQRPTLTREFAPDIDNYTARVDYINVYATGLYSINHNTAPTSRPAGHKLTYRLAAQVDTDLKQHDIRNLHRQPLYIQSGIYY